MRCSGQSGEMAERRLYRNPTCQKCGRKVAAKAGNTSTLFSQLRKCHPSIQIKVFGIYSSREFQWKTKKGKDNLI
ncbi:hypothetical protein F2P81_019855 [Scophthalmus maximus]|uniref:Uncharacterized protein n=1 Tax=Scophthalmus maximus TaxID=52904 RepID=A0A6A4S8Y6_SCOMX|nr:hypothetical protein F2P81_019855 [Scophthalmus maximus]